MRTWRLAATLQIDENFVTQKCAFLGTSGSGKTYGAGVLVEGLVAMDQQVVVIDTVGNWWGLRLASDGQSRGLDIPVLGGDRGDLPLAPEHGELVAGTVASTKSSVVIDVSDFTDGELRKFVTAFARSLLVAKKKSPTPVMIVWEECQDIIPQTMYGDDAKMVGAVQRLIKRGRNYGIGTALISQRSAAVNKGCLNQIETLFAFRTTAPLDRKAISDWVDHVGAEAIAAKGKSRPHRLTDQIHQLETGACIVYSPHVLERLEVVKILPKHTFNASATPGRDAIVATHLRPINLGELEQQLASVIREAEENDTSTLKAKIKELEGKLAHGSDAQYDKRRIELLEQQVNTLRAEKKALADLTEHRALVADRLVRAATEVVATIERALAGAPDLATARKELVNAAPSLASGADGEREELESRARRESWDAVKTTYTAPPGTSADLSKMERKMLIALAQYGRCNRSRLRLLTGYADSGPVSKAFAKLVAMQWASEDGGTFELTQRGKNALGSYTLLPSGDRLRRHLLNGDSRLSTAEKKLLDAVCSVYPRRTTRAKVRELAGYADSGPISKAMAKLVGMGYVVEHGREIVASEELFG